MRSDLLSILGLSILGQVALCPGPATWPVWANIGAHLVPLVLLIVGEEMRQRSLERLAALLAVAWVAVSAGVGFRSFSLFTPFTLMLSMFALPVAVRIWFPTWAPQLDRIGWKPLAAGLISVGLLMTALVGLSGRQIPADHRLGLAASMAFFAAGLLVALGKVWPVLPERWRWSGWPIIARLATFCSGLALLSGRWLDTASEIKGRQLALGVGLILVLFPALQAARRQKS